MKKIPTLFRRDPDNMKYVLPEVNPGCEWVIAGEGIATVKLDGVCVMLDTGGRWWARREVKPDKTAPPNYLPVETDSVTGKTVGWEPMDQSAFAKFHHEAERNCRRFGDPIYPGTYELVGPKINGNPHRFREHTLEWHGWDDLKDVPTDYVGLRELFAGWRAAAGEDHPPHEGIVWHHPDGRRAKLKLRDFPRTPVSTEVRP